MRTKHKRPARLWLLVCAVCLSGVALCAVSVTAQRAPGARANAEADRLLAEAQSLMEQGTREALEQAQAKLSAALPLYQAAGDKAHEAETLNAAGMVYSKLGAAEQALAHFERALPLYRAAGDRAGQAVVLNNMGLVSSDVGALQAALDYYEQALPLLRAVKDAGGEAVTLNNIGGLYFTLGELQQARVYLEQALALRRAARDPGGEAVTLTNLGDLYQAAGDNRQALAAYQQALPLYRAAGDKRSEAVALSQIGQLYAQAHDLQRAVEYYQQALPLSRAAGDRSGEALTLSHVGSAFLAIGEQQEAVETYRQVLALYQSLGDRRGEAQTLFNIAFNERGTGDTEGALRDIEAALALLESLRASIGSRELRSSYFASVQDYYEFYIDLLMQLHKQRPAAGYDARALQVSERARARSLLETLAEAGADIRQGVEPALLARERDLQQRLNDVAQARVQLLNGPHDEQSAATLAQQLDAVTAEFRQVEAEIRRTSPRYAALTQPQPLALAELQQTLDKDTLLLEYALGPERSYLWVVAPDALRSYELPKREEIEDAARRLYATLTAPRQWPAGANTSAGANADAKTNANAGAGARRGVLAAPGAQGGGAGPAAAARLANLVLAPAAAQLAGKRLLVVADGALQYVPFAALSSPGADAYRPLITEHEIVTLPSASTAAVLRRETHDRPPATKTLAVLADPVFTADDPRLAAVNAARPQGATAAAPRTAAAVGPRAKTPGRPARRGLALGGAKTQGADDAGGAGFGARIPRLPGTRAEAEQILALAPADARMQAFDFGASRAAAFDPALGAYRFVHFATHGFVDSQRPELSGIMLSMYDAQGRPQDGFLRAHEVYNLKLAADVVVLSACQTGLGKEIRGEGLVGLTRGFMYAGAPRVVVSLWSVSDAATAELMARFYRGLLVDKLRPAAALQQAQVAMLRDGRYAAPFYWAAFTLQGEWR
ncbi:MAG TPA: CHAT domain-containing protein [Pyrinomonadaceae bacterium]|jgi:CHAT domain-containing protein/tetratricopeptide (TPR) repeat protein